MNKLSTVIMVDPYGKEAECIQFTIEDTTKPFILNDIMAIGEQYTFSLWLMSDLSAGLSVVGDTFAATPVWNQYSITFSAEVTDLSLSFETPGIYYIYHPQLENGNKMTDWTPAPEDQPEEMATRFSVEVGKIEAQFTVVNKSINDLGEAIKDKYSKTITENENGITVTDSNGVYSIQLDNISGVTIRKNGVVRSQLIDDDFYTGNIVVRTEERAQFGNFAYVPRSDGSLSFLKVGG